uniref:Apolipoprotein D n=1 Tax=Cacopsylla melanoneura TaxID=428564 RepID=A0A8D8TUG3_9HEMI
MKPVAVLAVLGLILGVCHAHTYHLGECPTMEPQSEFNMKQFLGLWYVIQKTSTSSKCLIYNITQSPDEPSVYRIEQTNPIPGVGKPYHYTGELTVPIPSVPAKMTAKFPLSVAGSADYTVFLTDYTTYAGIFTCQKLPLSNRHSATILSRTKSLDKIYVEKLKSALTAANVNPFDLSIIDQAGCPKDYDSGIYIHKETFSAHNIANAIRNGSESVGNGVETVLDKAGSVGSSAGKVGGKLYDWIV